MRIRTIKPEFFLHEQLFEAERQTGLPLRLAYIGLWCAADREGRFKWEPRKLGIQILPYDEVDFSRVLDALTTRGFVVNYASTTGEFGYIPTFKDHQVINNREGCSILPTPPQTSENQQIDAWPTRDARDDDGNAELKSGREGKGKEGNNTLPLAAEAAPKKQAEPADPRFKPFMDAFCTEYEKATGHKYAVQGQKDGSQLKRLLKALPDVQIDEWCRSLEWCRQVAKNDVYAKSCVKTTGSLAAFASAWPQILDYSQSYKNP